MELLWRRKFCDQRMLAALLAAIFSKYRLVINSTESIQNRNGGLDGV